MSTPQKIVQWHLSDIKGTHTLFFILNDCSESVVIAVSVGGVTVVMFHTQDKAVPTRELMPFSAQR